MIPLKQEARRNLDNALIGEFAGITHQIQNDLLKLGNISFDFIAIFGNSVIIKFNRIAIFFSKWVGGNKHFIHQPPQRHCLKVKRHLSSLNLGKIKDIINQTKKMLCGRQDLFKVLFDFF